MVVPPKHPQNDNFYQENPWLLGTTILGNPHMTIYVHTHMIDICVVCFFNNPIFSAWVI